MEKVLIKCVVVWVSAVVHQNPGTLPAARERFGRHYLWSNKLGHRFSEIYLVSCYISSVEIQCKVTAEVLLIRTIRLFWLSLSGELYYIEHFFSVWIIFYKKTENQKKRNYLGTVLQWVLITTVCRHPEALEYSRKFFCWMSCSAQEALWKWKHVCLYSPEILIQNLCFATCKWICCEFRNLNSHNC